MNNKSRLRVFNPAANRNKKGADTLLTLYWFLIVFIVAGAVFYMASLFYGTPFDVRNAEGYALSNQIANCLTTKGYLNDQVLSPDFQKNFPADCNLNFTTEDFSDWKTVPQYYAEVKIYKFSPGEQYYGESQSSVASIYGDQLVGLSFGNPNLKASWEITLQKPALFSFLTPKRSVDTIVIHATEGQSAVGAIQMLSQRGINIHYVIDRDGTIYSLNNNPTPYTNAFVSDNDVAQHAGCVDPATHNEKPTCSANCVSNGLLVPSCQAYTNPGATCCIEGFNPKSIGIELVNLGDACTDIHYKNSVYCQDSISADGKNWENFSDAQINALASLVSNLAAEYSVPLDRNHIIGHDQIAAYKIDPGPQFPWDRFMQDLTPKGAIASSLPESAGVSPGQQQRSFYAIDKNGNQYIIQVLTLIGKNEKNV